MSPSDHHIWLCLYWVTFTGSLNKLAFIWRHASAFGGSNLTDEKEGAVIVILLNQSSQFLCIFAVDYRSSIKNSTSDTFKSPMLGRKWNHSHLLLRLSMWFYRQILPNNYNNNNNRTHFVSYKLKLGNMITYHIIKLELCVI